MEKLVLLTLLLKRRLLMRTGEKITRLRKENNYTQEQLADLLGVSRQSVSKWESDLTLPETDKLIQMAKMFNCSIDYLLNEDKTQKDGTILEVKDENDVDSSQQKSSFESNKPSRDAKHIFLNINMLWGIGYLVISLLLYALPYLTLTATITTGFPPYSSTITITVSLNVYELISSPNYQWSNFIVLLAFLVMLSQTLFSVLLVFIHKKGIHNARFILAFVEFGLWMILLLMFGGYANAGTILLPIISLTNAILIVVLKKLKFTPLAV